MQDEKDDEAKVPDYTHEVVELDPIFVIIGDLIAGMERVTWQKDMGAGALEPRVLPSPSPMTKTQRETHDLTHLPYEAACDICVSARRPNSHHQK